MRAVLRNDRFAYDPDPKSYDLARAQAFEQRVMDVKESSMVARALPVPQSPPPTCLGAT